MGETIPLGGWTTGGLTHFCKYGCIYIYIFIYIYIYVSIFVYICIHTYVYIYIFIHIFVYTYELCSKFLFISWPRIQSLRRSLRSLTFSKVLLTAQQFQRTSLRISYGKHRQTKELSASGKHMPGRCKIFTRSAQVPQVRLAKCCFHWLLNCRSLRRFHCSVGIDPFLSVPLGSSLAKTLCFCGKPFLTCFPWSRHAMRLKLFWLLKRRVTSFCSPGDGSTGCAMWCHKKLLQLRWMEGLGAGEKRWFHGASFVGRGLQENLLLTATAQGPFTMHASHG